MLCRTCRQQRERLQTPLAYDPALITASNYLRVVASVVMRGLVKCKNDETFFQGESRGSYARTGAKDVVGLTLYEYQQLIRLLHLVNSEARPGADTDDYDKCYYLRPLIALLQQAFARWFIHPREKQCSRRDRSSLSFSMVASLQQG